MSKELVVLDLIIITKRKVLENFWSSSISKSAFQDFYVEWVTTNYEDTKPLYLGISPQSWFVSAGHTSAQLYTWRSWWLDDVPCARHCKSPLRTYIFHQVTHMSLCACYTTVQSIGETLLWLVRNSGVRRSILPSMTFAQRWEISSHSVSQHWLGVTQPAR